MDECKVGKIVSSTECGVRPESKTATRGDEERSNFRGPRNSPTLSPGGVQGWPPDGTEYRVFCFRMPVIHDGLDLGV
jgi:hypothetical protein